MIEALDAIEEKYNELNKKLTDPNIISNIKKMTEISKEISDLEEVVNLYHKYKDTLKELKDTENLMNDNELKEIAKEENKRLEEEKEKLEGLLEKALIPKDENDNKNALIEIRGAAGGDEANIFAGDLFNMYLKYAEEKGFSTEIYAADHSENGGFPYVSFKVKGKGAYGFLKYESGSHRVQRVPVTETSGRVHTSTATVLVMPEVKDAEDVKIEDKDIRIDIYRSSGKGGQGVNTTDSAVRITHLPTGIVATCQNERSQIQNKAEAMNILRIRLKNYYDEIEAEKEGKERLSKIGTGDRSEKIRTYNYPQNRVTDHRINFSYMNLDRVMEGDLEPIISALIMEDEKRRISNSK